MGAYDRRFGYDAEDIPQGLKPARFLVRLRRFNKQYSVENLSHTNEEHG
jgi:hypothetical protein